MKLSFSLKSRGSKSMMEPSQQALYKSLHRFTEILSPEELQALTKIQGELLPTGIRFNSLKVDSAQTIKDLSARYGWKVQPIPFCNHAWTIHHSDVSPGITIEHRMGQYYLQDPASMLPASLFNVKEQRYMVLDMAASPGGKTTHLIDRTHDKGFVIANDGSKSRIAALRAVLTTWGGINQVVTQYPGEAFGDWFPETFDLVLLDAPCSMENLRPTPAHPYRDTTQDERLRLQERQIQLLISGLKVLKVGGQLVYATCSLAPEEDEAVINALLISYPDASSIVDVSQIVNLNTPGLTHFQDIAYHPSLDKALRLWPHLTGMSGFFCVLLTKVNPIHIESLPPPYRDFSKTDLQLPERKIREEVYRQLESNFGWDLEQVLEDYELKLYQRFDQLFLIPGAYLQNFSSLPYKSIGMALGQWHSESLEPAPEFISRFGSQFKRGKIIIEADQVLSWVSGRDIRYPSTQMSPEGQYLLVTDADGRNLGMGKLLSKRLRNMLPRSLF